jgi:hypothetical protein
MNAIASMRARREAGLRVSETGHDTGERDWRARYPEFCERAKGTNVNDRTLLATDYLNHVNEIIMLLELVPDAPECLEDCRTWQPMSYTEHFEASSIADRDLAIEAYEFSPPRWRVSMPQSPRAMMNACAASSSWRWAPSRPWSTTPAAPSMAMPRSWIRPRSMASWT